MDWVPPPPSCLLTLQWVHSISLRKVSVSSHDTRTHRAAWPNQVEGRGPSRALPTGNSIFS